MDKVFDVLIVGGGIGGLATLHYLKKKNLDVVLLEKDSECGGLVKSKKDGEYLLETGPNAFLKSYQNTYDFVCELGLKDEIIYNKPEAYHRYIYRNKVIHALPESPVRFFKSNLLSLKAKLRLFLEPFVGRGPVEETIADFGKRRFGKEVTDIVLNAMVKGICTGDINKLDINSMFPKMKVIEGKYRSLLLFLLLFKKKNVKTTKDGKKSLFMSLKKGMGDISHQAYNQYKDHIKTSCEVLGVSKNDAYEVKTNYGEYKAKRIVFASQAPDAADILKDLYPDLSKILSEIPYANVGTVTLSYKKEDIDHPLDGFGFLSPSGEDLDILGGLFSSSLFIDRAPKDQKMVKVYLGGPEKAEAYNLNEAEMIELVEKNLTPVLGIHGSYQFAKAKKIKNAIPLFNIGHQDILKRLFEEEARLQDISLVGNYIGGISVDATIKRAQDVAERF